MLKYLGVLAVALAVYFYRSKSNTRQFIKFDDPPPNYKYPSPREQSQLYRSVGEIDGLKVTASGKIPAWLKGTLLRDGPGLFEFGSQKALHAFDGMAMIRRYAPDGNASMEYSRKFLESDVLRDNREAQRYTKNMVGVVPEGNMLDRLRSLKGPVADNMVVNTITLFGHYYAATELAQVIEYDPVTLETLGKVDMTTKIPGLMFQTPHPLYEKDGTMWNIAMCTGPGRDGKSSGAWRYVIYKVPKPKGSEDPYENLEVVAELPSTRSMSINYLHSFFMTERYVILPQQPWIIGDVREVIKNFVIKGQGMGNLMYWDPEEDMTFHVLDKQTGEFLPISYTADPMGWFHIFNAYEDSGFLVMDAPFKSQSVSYSVFQLDKLMSSADELAKYMAEVGPAAGISKRWILPTTVPEFKEPKEVKTGPDGVVDQNSFEQIIPKSIGEAKAWVVGNDSVYVHPELLAPASDYEVHRALEFGAVNPAYINMKYKYVYGLGFPTGYLAGSLGKLNVQDKRIEGWWQDEDCLATEPQFVPSPNSKSEEDGVLVSACLSSSTEETHLVVLDPVTMTELGRYTVPHRTPIGFHGVWLKE